MDAEEWIAKEQRRVARWDAAGTVIGTAVGWTVNLAILGGVIALAVVALRECTSWVK